MSISTSFVCLSSKKVSTDSNCSSFCLENVKIFKEQNEQLLKDLRASKVNDITYKTYLESVEARLLVYKKNESVYEEDIKVLKREIYLREVAITELRNKSKAVRKNNGALIIEDWMFDSEKEGVPQAKIEKKTVEPSLAKIKFVKSKEQVISPRKTIKQGSNFEMFNKACYVCGSFDHLQYNCDNHQRQFKKKEMIKLVWNYTQRVNHQNFTRMTHPSPKRNMVPKAVLMKLGLVSLTTARPVNTAQPKTTVNSARTMTNIFNKTHSTVRRPINNKTSTKNSNFNQRVNTVKDKNVNTARPKVVVNTARPKAVLNVIKGNKVNAVKALAYPRNMSYLTDFEEIDGGYVAFGGNPKGGKITGKDHLGKFDGKANEGFFVGYSINSKAFRVFNSRTRIAEENLHVQFNKHTPIIVGSGPNWLFDIDALTKSMNYKPIITGNRSNGNAGDDEKKITEEPRKECDDSINAVGAKTSIKLPLDPNMPELEDIVYSDDDEDVGAEADMNNLDALIPVSPILTTREELLQFKLQEVWALVELPNGKRAIGTKWVFRNKKDERGIVIKNKARLVAQGYTQEERIDYDEVFAPVARIEAIRLFLAYASFKDFVVYWIDVKSAFLYGLKVKQNEDGIFISQDKYMTEILKKFGFTDVKTVSTPMETKNPLLKHEDGEKVDVHLYRSMIGSLMYLTSSRPDIMFVVCACVRYQVNPKVSHLHAVKRIFRYLKGQPKLGLCYPKDSPFDLVAYTDSDYDGASLDRKSITGCCQLLGCRLISWQCKKQTVVANSVTKAKERGLEWNGKAGQDGIRFWAIAKVKTINGVVQLQALVDGKKIIVTEASIRSDLQLDDADGMDCLPNATIFEELTRMGYEKISQSMGNFLKYLRFVQVFVNQQVGDMSIHDKIYVTPSHTKKGEGSVNPNDPYHTPTITQPSSSQPQKKQKPKKHKKKDTQIPQSSVPSDNVAEETINEDNVPTYSNDPLLSDEDILKLEELMELYTNLQNRVLDLEHIKTTQALEIESLKGESRSLRRSKDEGLDHKDASKQGRKIHDICVFDYSVECQINKEDCTTSNKYSVQRNKPLVRDNCSHVKSVLLLRKNVRTELSQQVSSWSSVLIYHAYFIREVLIRSRVDSALACYDAFHVATKRLDSLFSIQLSSSVYV
ncbi:putative ribonuclease H-like domain-containing protein [Tanacetum coccineum]